MPLTPGPLMMNPPVDSEMIVGPRYAAKDVRAGSGDTIVISDNAAAWRDHDRRTPLKMAVPLAGGMYRRFHTDGGKKKWFGWCNQCGALSKNFTRKHEPSLKVWAQNHRCAQSGTQYHDFTY